MNKFDLRIVAAVWHEWEAEIREWSKHNFYNNTNKSEYPVNPFPGIIRLDMLAPLMGMAEELGEYCEAKTREESADAQADFLIYFLDFYWRHNEALGARKPPQFGNVYTVSLDWTWYWNKDTTWHVVMSAMLGRINHAYLKSMQQIRGYGERDEQSLQKFITEVEEACAIIRHKSHSPFVMENLQVTWDKIVSKRNWNANKINGTESEDGNGTEAP